MLAIPTFCGEFYSDSHILLFSERKKKLFLILIWTVAFLVQKTDAKTWVGVFLALSSLDYLHLEPSNIKILASQVKDIYIIQRIDLAEK